MSDIRALVRKCFFGLDLSTYVALLTGTQTIAGAKTFSSVVAASAGLILGAVSTKTTTYTVLGSDYLVRVDTTSGSLTMTLPTAVGRTGQVYAFKKLVAGNTMTIATTSSQTIDGASTATATAQYATILVISNGANWDRLN